MGAVLGEGIGHGFEVNGKSFQVNDAQVSAVGFPDLSLFEFHSGVRMVVDQWGVGVDYWLVRARCIARAASSWRLSF